MVIMNKRAWDKMKSGENDELKRFYKQNMLHV